MCDTSVTCETSTDAEDVATETVGKLVTGTEELNCKLKEEVSANYRVKQEFKGMELKEIADFTSSS